MYACVPPTASPLHQQTSKYRAVGMHPAYLGHAGHASLHGTPRHTPRVPQPKGNFYSVTEHKMSPPMYNRNLSHFGLLLSRIYSV